MGIASQDAIKQFKASIDEIDEQLKNSFENIGALQKVGRAGKIMWGKKLDQSAYRVGCIVEVSGFDRWSDSMYERSPWNEWIGLVFVGFWNPGDVYGRCAHLLLGLVVHIGGK